MTNLTFKGGVGGFSEKTHHHTPPSVRGVGGFCGKPTTKGRSGVDAILELGWGAYKVTMVPVYRGGPSWLGLLPRARAIQEECNHGSVKKLTEGSPTGGSAVSFERHSLFWRTFRLL